MVSRLAAAAFFPGVWWFIALSGDTSNMSSQSVPEISMSVPGEEMAAFVVKRFQRRPTLPVHCSQGSSQAIDTAPEDLGSPGLSQVDLCFSEASIMPGSGIVLRQKWESGLMIPMILVFQGLLHW